jgi:hypothetical protein
VVGIGRRSDLACFLPLRLFGRPNSEEDSGMTTFDEREKAFEKKFAHDEELRFRATARRNRLFGLWAAEKLGLSGTEADEYAKSVVRADFQEPGDEDVLRKVRGDFDAKNIDQSDHQLQRTLNDMMTEAVRQIENERGQAS